MEFRTVQLRLPNSALLAEINLPSELIASLAGRTITAQVFPEEQAATRRAERDENPVWIALDGTYWNDYRPLGVCYTDPEGHVWRFPCRWLNGSEPVLDIPVSVSQEITFAETLHLATAWDLSDVNIPWDIAAQAKRMPPLVQVHIAPEGPVEVLWKDSKGNFWRIPHDWRRRRILLPSREVLVSQGIPEDVASVCAQTIVSVNYHPGSLCCLPEHFRFRDSDGNRWPVKTTDCELVGYGDTLEFRA